MHPILLAKTWPQWRRSASPITPAVRKERVSREWHWALTCQGSSQMTLVLHQGFLNFPQLLQQCNQLWTNGSNTGTERVQFLFKPTPYPRGLRDRHSLVQNVCVPMSKVCIVSTLAMVFQSQSNSFTLSICLKKEKKTRKRKNSYCNTQRHRANILFAKEEWSITSEIKARPNPTETNMES